MNPSFKYRIFTANTSDSITDEIVQRMYSNDAVLAEITHPDQSPIQYKIGDAPVSEKLEKFVEDVK